MTSRRPASGSTAALGRLARLYGAELAHVDGTGTRTRVGEPSLIAVLRALGAPVDDPDDAAEVARRRERAWWRTPLEPVVTAWQGRPASFELRGRSAILQGRVPCEVRLENRERTQWTADLGTRHPRTAPVRVDGETCVRVRLALPRRLPLGYHTLTVELAGRRWSALLIAAPWRAYDPPQRGWGVFLPTYALRTAQSWGVGDYTDLTRLISWVADLGGGQFSTLPLLPGFLEGPPTDPSPYAPTTRLFWNELYVDPRQTTEFARSPTAQALAASTPFGRELTACRRGRYIDYPRVMRLKRQVLELLAADLADRDDRRAHAFRRFARRPLVQRYTAFRATGERLKRPWPEWPERLRRGDLDDRVADEAARRYHAYAQWIAAEQVEALAHHARAVGSGLYLDAPLGVHPASYDVWAHRRLFATGVTAGAPPDALFTQGQNWGFPPLHPEANRRDRYRYLRASFAHLAGTARTLRLDHVMGLHRLYWIPDEGGASAGVYVTYPADELYAVLTLESHRHQVAIVGEDLGTVPPVVTRAMDAHGLRRMYVQQFQIRPGAARPLAAMPRHAVASLNTHDTPSFSAYFAGLDLATSVSLGWMTGREAAGARRWRTRLRHTLARALGLARTAPDSSLRAACLQRLARSRASLVLVNLEDLWGETAPQNVPGTGPERANWRRRARFGFERFRQRPEIVETLRALAALRPTSRSPAHPGAKP